MYFSQPSKPLLKCRLLSIKLWMYGCKLRTYSGLSSIPISTGLYSVQKDTEVLPKTKWNFVCAVCVERMPQISRQFLPVQSQYSKFILKKEVAKSRMNDFEFDQYSLDKELAKIRSSVEKGQVGERQLTDLLGKQADTEEMLHSLRIEYQNWIPAPRRTSADENHDLTSLQRCLDRPLYLLVRKPRNQHVWQFSQQTITNFTTNSLRELALTQLSENFGSNFITNVHSTMPQAYLSYLYSASEDQQQVGSNVFIMKSVYASGDVQLISDKFVDYVWLTKSEIKDYVTKKYFQVIEPLLFE